MSDHERYRVFALPSAAESFERAVWDDYYATECAARGLREGVDSLDSRQGAVLPLAEAVTTAAGGVSDADGVPVVRLATEIHDSIDPAGMVTLDELPQAVRDALEGRGRAPAGPDRDTPARG